MNGRHAHDPTRAARFGFGEFDGHLVDDVPVRYIRWLAACPATEGSPRGFDFSDLGVAEAVYARCRREGIDPTKKRSGKNENFIPRGRFKKLYEAYLHSDEWREKRERWIEERGYECERCGRGVTPEEGANVHHLTYERLGDERDEDVEVLCRECHERESRGEEPRLKVAPAGEPAPTRPPAIQLCPATLRYVRAGGYHGGREPPEPVEETVSDPAVLEQVRDIEFERVVFAAPASWSLGQLSHVLGFCVQRIVNLKSTPAHLERTWFVDGLHRSRNWFTKFDLIDFDSFNTVVKRTAAFGMERKWRSIWDRVYPGIMDCAEKIPYRDFLVSEGKDY